MLPLTMDDLLPLEEYAGRRREFFEAHCRYLDRYRRVRIGPRLTLVFENRQTLWFRVQEIVRIARLADERRVQQELALYNQLLPQRDCLQAALLIEITDESKLARELARWQNWQNDDLRLRLGEQGYPSTLVTCRPEDRCVGTAQWVQFRLGAAARHALANPVVPASFAFQSTHYSYQSAQLNEDVRQSLLDDLILSERDAAA